MARDIKFRVIADEDTRALKKVGDELDNVANKGDKADASLRRMGQGHRALTAEIDRTIGSIKNLHAEFERTGDLGLLGDIDKQGRNLKKLQTQLANIAGDSGAESATKFSAGFLRGIGPAGIAIAAGLAVPVTAAVSAAVATGVTLGIGGGALAGGIALAAQDNRVKGAWGDMFADVADAFSQKSVVFVEPLVSAANVIGNALLDAAGRAGGAFASLAPHISTLAAGVAGLINNIDDGFDSLINTAGPFLDILADELPNIGNALDDFFGSIAAAGPGAAMFFKDFLVFTEKVIVSLGNIIEFGSKLYQVLSFLGGDFLDPILGGEDRVAKSNAVWHEAGDSVRYFGQSALDTAADINDLIEGISKTTTFSSQADHAFAAMADRIGSALLDLDKASLNFAESQTKLGEAINKNGLQLDIQTAKGQANREAILGAVQANLSLLNANVSSGMSAEQATAAYESNTRALESQLRQAGLTQGEIDGLIGKYRNVPANVNTQIATLGLTNAINDLANLIRVINGIPSVKTIELKTIRYDLTIQEIRSGFANKGYATGGNPPVGQPFWVGERGPELMFLNQPSTVLSHSQSLSYSGRSPSLGQAATVRFDFTGADNEFRKFFQKIVRVDGGGDVQVAFGR